MKIITTINGKTIEIDDPGLIEQDGKWWESVEYRVASYNEYSLTPLHPKTVIRSIFAEGCAPGWIVQEIPKPTDAQVRAIGKVLEGAVPVLCVEGDFVWTKHGPFTAVGCLRHHIGKYRWRLKDTPKVDKDCRTFEDIDPIGGHHGYQPREPEYQLLQLGDIIQFGDEWCGIFGEHFPSNDIGRKLTDEYDIQNMKYRRLVKPAQPNDLATEASNTAKEELAACQQRCRDLEELSEGRLVEIRRLYQRIDNLARKLKFSEETRTEEKKILITEIERNAKLEAQLKERPTIGQVQDWLLGNVLIWSNGVEPPEHVKCNRLLRCLAKDIEDSEDGIAAVNNRKESGK